MSGRSLSKRVVLALVATLTITLPAVPPSGQAAEARTFGPANLLRNGSFESGKRVPIGWAIEGSGRLEKRKAHDGSRSVSLSSGRWVANAVAPGPAGAYRALSGWFLTPRPGAQVDGARLRVQWIDGAGAEIGNRAGSNVRGEVCNDYYYSWAGPWCFQLFVVVVPSGAAKAVVSVVADGNNLSSWFVDEVFFGPVTSAPTSARSALHEPSPPPPPGTAAVSINAKKVVRDIPTWLFGDNEQYMSSALATKHDDGSVTAHIRNTSRPGVVRFPGGNITPLYDWEHPDSQSGCINLPPVPKSCGAPAPTADIDELMRFVRASGVRDVIWTLNVSGQAPGFTVRYTGTASRASLSVDHASLRVKLAGDQTDGTNDLRVDFRRSRRISAVLDVINGTPGYEAAMVRNEEARRNDRVLDELVHLDHVDARAPATVSVDTGNIHKVLRLIDYANNPRSTIVGPSGKTRDQVLASRGFPRGPYRIRFLELGNENSFIANQSGGLDPVTFGRKMRGYAAAIHKADPKAKVGLTGITSMMGEDGTECCGAQGAHYVFSMTMFREAGAELDFIVDHVYENFHVTYSGLLTFPQHIQRINPVRWIQDLFQKYSPDHRPDIDVYVTEFNTITYDTFVPSPLLSRTYQLVNALVIADWLGVYQDIGAAMTVHHDQLDFPFGSHVSWTDENGETQISTQAGGYALTLFNQHWGNKLLRTSYRSPTYSTPEPDGGTRGNLPPGATVLGFPWQTAYSSLSADGNRLYVMLINKSGTDPIVPSDADMPLQTTVTLKGFDPKPTATLWTVNGRDRSAAKLTQSISSTQVPTAAYEHDPDAYSLTRSKISNARRSFRYTTPAHSVTVIELERK